MKNQMYREPALQVCGIVFSILGAIFTILGAVFYVFLDELRESSHGGGDIVALPISFLAVGISFLILGILLIVIRTHIIGRKKRLKEGGYYVTAVISGMHLNTAVRINNKSPYYLECIYEDPYTGIKHLFRSDCFKFCAEDLSGKEVRVYYNHEAKEPFKNYYVDVEPLFQKLVVH